MNSPTKLSVSRKHSRHVVCWGGGVHYFDTVRDLFPARKMLMHSYTKIVYVVFWDLGVVHFSHMAFEGCCELFSMCMSRQTPPPPKVMNAANVVCYHLILGISQLDHI